MGTSSELIGGYPDDSKPDRDLDTDDLLRRAVERVNGWFDYFNVNIMSARDDMYFLMVNQWDPDLLTVRTEAQKPCLQVNYIYAILTSLLGQIRKNTPAFKVQAVIDESNPNVKVDQKDIELRANLLRQIYFENNADQKFQTAAQSSLGRGFGALLVHTEYRDPMSFDQKIVIRAFNDPINVFFDPLAELPDKSDGRYCGWMDTYTIDEFKDAFPEAESSLRCHTPRSFPSVSLSKSYANIWRGEDWIRIANYIVQESYPITLAKLSDGRSMELSKAKEEIEAHKSRKRSLKLKENKVKDIVHTLTGNMPQGSIASKIPQLEIVDTRPSIDYKLKHYKMSYDEILEESEWPSKLLPVIFVDGDSYYVDGQQYTKSFHKTAKDPQRIQNLMISDAVDNMQTSHKPLFIGTPENFEGYEQLWRNPSLTPGALIANRDQAGQMPMPVPPPQISPSYGPLMQQAGGDVSRTLGYYEENQGAESNAQSGVAINNRAKNGNLSNFIYFDNLNRAIDRTAKVCLSLVPAIYDTTRTIVVRREDGDQSVVKINNPTADSKTMQNDLTMSNFTVDVEVASNYEIQKQENLAQLQGLLQAIAPANPAIATLLSDLFAANLDLENTAQIVERMRDSMLGMSPQQILQKEMGITPPPGPPQPNPMQMQMQMQQQQMQVEQERMQLDRQKIQADLQKQQMQSQNDALKAHADAVKSMTELQTAKIDSKTRIVEAHAASHQANQNVIASRQSAKGKKSD